MSYTPYHADWLDYPDTTTPLTAAALEYIEQGIVDAAATADSATTTANAAIAKALVDAKGDLIVATAADTVARKAVGASDGMALFVKAANSDGLEWAFPPGHEYAATSVTANVSVTATAEASADTVITNGAVTYDGSTEIFIEAHMPRVILPNVASIGIVFSLWDSGTEITRLGVLLNNGEATGSLTVPVYLKYRITPSAGSHTYSLRAHMSATATATIQSGVGTGGSGVHSPSYLRQVKV